LKPKAFREELIMAITVSEEKTIKLLDGQEITIRPLKVSLLRPFLKKFQAIQDVAEVQIAMQQFKPELAGDIKALEEVLDLPTVYKIVEEASGNSTIFGALNK
jgi:hypothetical protein